MSAPTNAPVLAWVSLWGWRAEDRHGAGNWFPSEAEAKATAELWDRTVDAHAPHTVQQLARVVRVVAVDDAMVERGVALRAIQDAIATAVDEIDKQYKAGVPDSEQMVNFAQIAAHALAAALTPPEPTGTEGA